MTDREAALSGALLRACMLISRGWDDARIIQRLKDDYYQMSERQYRMLVILAHLGVDFCKAQKWNDPEWEINMAAAPQLPQG